MLGSYLCTAVGALGSWVLLGLGGSGVYLLTQIVVEVVDVPSPGVFKLWMGL